MLDFAPDANRLLPGVLSSVTSLVPTVNQTYKPSAAPFTEGYATAVASTEVIGSAIVKNAAGTALLYAGTTAKLLQANGTTGWTDRSGTTYSGSSTGSWSFAQDGDNTLAANGVDKIQKATGGSFADLNSSAPTAKIVIMHELAALAFNTSSAPDGWYRSDTGDVTNWTASAANDVDTGNLRGGGTGPVTAANVWGSYAIAWKQNAMYAGVFNAGAIGGTADAKIRWDFVPGGAGIGCVGQHAHITTDIGLIFVSDRDIFVYDGSRPLSIAKKVRRYFFRNAVSKSQIFITHNEIERNIYIWFAISSTYPTRALVYNYEQDLWGELDDISNQSDTYTYVRAPVRNANYTDYTAVGGIATNTGLECNATWAHASDGSGSRLVNFAASKGAVRTVQPALTTGIIGRKDRDSRWTKLVILGASNPTPTLSTAAGNIYLSVNAAAGSNWTGGVGVDGHAHMVVDARLLDATLTWSANASASSSEIADILPQSTPTGADIGMPK